MVLAALLAASSLTLSAQELPKKDASEVFDFEPKLLLNDVPNLPLPGSTGTAAPSLNVTKLESELARAKTTAVRREKLFKSGVLSKVEAEQATLKVVRLARDLETTRLQALTRHVEELRKLAEKDDASKSKLTEAEATLAALTATATEASAKWDQAQRAAAELRVQRERKLLALGAGSRASVKRAETALQSLAPQP
jgi:multidrug resistance efflux pump